MQKIKNKVFELLHRGSGSNSIAWMAKTLELLIIVNVFAVILESFEDLDQKYHLYFEYFEIFTVSVFLLEFLLRIWISDMVYPTKTYLKSIKKTIFSANGIIDLLAILPFFIPFIINVDLRNLRVLRLTRLLRVFQINRYNHSLKLITKVLDDKKTELLGTLIIASCVMIVAATLMYNFEKDAQPDKFTNIVNAFWWCVVTLTTIGYGDIVPVTLAGKILGGTVALMGVLLMAIPIGLLSTGFVQNLEEFNKKKRLQLIRNQIKEAFRKKFVPELGCEVRRGALSIEAIKVSLEISDDELIKLAEGKNEFNYRRISIFVNHKIVFKFCLEYRECNTLYGVFHKKESNIGIVSAESHNKQSIGYFAYCLSEMLQASLMSNEFFGEEAVFIDETFADKGVDLEGTYNFSNAHNYETEQPNEPYAFGLWKKHLHKMMSKKQSIIIVDTHNEFENPEIKFNILNNEAIDETNFAIAYKYELKRKNVEENNIRLSQVVDNHYLNYMKKECSSTLVYVSIPQILLIKNIFATTAATCNIIKSKCLV